MVFAGLWEKAFPVSLDKGRGEGGDCQGRHRSILSMAPATPVCRDPFDLPFLQLAIAGKAEYPVTGDHDLLSLDGRFVCPITAADQFINTLNP